MMPQRHPSEREANYRGYEIKLERHDLCWSVDLKETAPIFRPRFGANFTPSLSPSERQWPRLGGASMKAWKGGSLGNRERRRPIDRSQ